VLGADGVMAQPRRLLASFLERPLGAGAQGVRIDARSGRRLAQRGFASSISMMGIPSSTG
jgi:hypothetical protein